MGCEINAMRFNKYNNRKNVLLITLYSVISNDYSPFEVPLRGGAVIL